MENRPNGTRKLLSEAVLFFLGVLFSLITWIYLNGQGAQADINKSIDQRVSTLEQNMVDIKTSLATISERTQWLDKLKK